MLANQHGRRAVTVGLEDVCEALTTIEVMSTAAAAREMELTEERQKVERLERSLFYMKARLDRELGKISGHQLGAILEDE